jgi:hypothetical protein
MLRGIFDEKKIFWLRHPRFFHLKLKGSFHL